MVSWRQFWHGYWTSFRLSGDLFANLVTPPGWSREVFLRIRGRTIYFVYPDRPDSARRKRDRIL
jgi:hypothetical protein